MLRPARRRPVRRPAAAARDRPRAGDAAAAAGARRADRRHPALDHQGYRPRHRLSAQSRADGDRAGRAVSRFRAGARRPFRRDGARRGGLCVRAAPSWTRRRSSARWRSSCLDGGARRDAARWRRKSGCDLRGQSRASGASRSSVEARRRQDAARDACTRRARCACAFPARRPASSRRCSSTRRAASPAATASTSTSRSGEGARLVVTTAAAEKVYRTLGPDSDDRREARCRGRRDARLAAAGDHPVRPRAAVAHASRSMLAPDAQLLLAEAIVFGRSGMGETVRGGRAVRPLARAPRRQADLRRERAARRRDCAAAGRAGGRQRRRRDRDRADRAGRRRRGRGGARAGRRIRRRGRRIGLERHRGGAACARADGAALRHDLVACSDGAARRAAAASGRTDGTDA